MNDTNSPTHTPATPSPVHLSRDELVAGYRSLPPAPTDQGRVALIVRRPDTDLRETPERVQLSPEHGVPGDAWGREPDRNPDAQITVIRRDVVGLLGNGQPMTVPGDNLVVDLDLSAGNLPAGTRLLVGNAIVEVTPEPHDGCSKFQKRFGADALRFVSAKETRHLNLRGIHFRVIEAGEVEVGAPIKVLSRPGKAD